MRVNRMSALRISHSTARGWRGRGSRVRCIPQKLVWIPAGLRLDSIEIMPAMERAMPHSTKTRLLGLLKPAAFVHRDGGKGGRGHGGGGGDDGDGSRRGATQAA